MAVMRASFIPKQALKEIIMMKQKGIYWNKFRHWITFSFLYGDYEELYSNQNNCMFYCDIPYKGTKQYGSSKNFDYDRFWKWATKMSEKNIVLVSEHQAPFGWECIWQQEVKRTIDNNKRVKAVEKLFEIRE